MTSKDAVNFDEIKRGFSTADPSRSKSGKKLDLKVKRVQESSRKFGNEALCAGGDVFGLSRV